MLSRSYPRFFKKFTNYSLKFPLLSHNLRCSSTVTESSSLCHLSHRSLINIQGKDSAKLLQGLLTNDVYLLHPNTKGNVIYSMFLNAQGRTEFDVMVYGTKDNDRYMIECDKSISNELITFIKRYKLRSKVKLDINEQMNVFCLFGGKPIDLSGIDSAYQDPRLPELGYRLLSPNQTAELAVSTNSIQGTLENYHQHRYILGISEGLNEIYNSIPLEHNIAFLNGVSFTKGCYIGQELVARAHHTGIIRKRIMPLKFSPGKINHGETIVNEKGKRVGKVIASYNDIGIGLMRLREAFDEKKIFRIPSENTDCIEVYVNRPIWWPNDVNY